MSEIFKEFKILKSDFHKDDDSKEIVIPEIDESSDKSAPYELQWEGDLERAPMIQPLPENTSDVNGSVTVRFEVKPDGEIGRIILIKKMNPELEHEVIRTLRSWRFSRLPSGIPQQSQWATITFRFSME